VAGPPPAGARHRLSAWCQPPRDDWGVSDERTLHNPARVVVIAYLMALLCLGVPLALVGAVFAGVVLARRGLPWTGAGVIALGLVCAALGVTVLR
jgi:hypothetical protein